MSLELPSLYITVFVSLANKNNKLQINNK
uniref:Uncharacterized protein n=1 Tax=Anguilla anguilla TaxID=7936 RepID=A0A0E9RWQ6_ANGAN